MLENITLNKKERIQPSRNKNHAKNSAIEKIQFFLLYKTKSRCFQNPRAIQLGNPNLEK